MSWLIAQVWILLLVAFVLGSAVAWLLHRLVPARRGVR
jgi:high-affinity Fe2+/Pb2+ permease